MNLSALRKVGFHANRRLLRVQRISHNATLGEQAFARLQGPTTVHGQRAAGLRFGDPRASSPCSPRYSCFGCCRAALPTATSASTSSRYSATTLPPARPAG